MKVEAVSLPLLLFSWDISDPVVTPDSYSILLPSNLPPTFRGRTFRFAYELVVGICRSSSDSVNASANGSEIFPNSASVKGQGKGPGGSVSKVMKVPIRVYTNVVGTFRLTVHWELGWC